MKSFSHSEKKLFLALHAFIKTAKSAKIRSSLPYVKSQTTGKENISLPPWKNSDFSNCFLHYQEILIALWSLGGLSQGHI